MHPGTRRQGASTGHTGLARHCYLICSSRKNPYPPHVTSSEIPRGRGVVKVLEAKSEAKMEFPGGIDGERGGETKNLLWVEYGYFLALPTMFHI